MGKGWGLPIQQRFLRTRKKLPAWREAAVTGCAAQQGCHVKENMPRGIAEQVSGYECVKWHYFQGAAARGKSLAQPALLPLVSWGFKAVWVFSQIKPRCVNWNRGHASHLEKGDFNAICFVNLWGMIGLFILGGGGRDGTGGGAWGAMDGWQRGFNHVAMFISWLPQEMVW